MMLNEEAIVIIFILLVALVIISSHYTECAILIVSIIALISYLIYLRRGKQKMSNPGLQAVSQSEARRLMESPVHAHSNTGDYLDYDQNLLSDYPSDPYITKPQLLEIPGNPESEDFDIDYYPGAVDFDDIESEDYINSGHTDRKEKPIQNDVTFDLNRTNADGLIPSEYADNSIIDGDEAIVNLARAKGENGSTRAVSGRVREKNFMERFVADEMNEFEGRIWYGNADY